MPDVAMDAVLLGLVEDVVPSAEYNGLERQLTLPHVAGDEALDCRGLAADGILGPGDEQERQVAGDARFVLRKPQIGGIP